MKFLLKRKSPVLIVEVQWSYAIVNGVYFMVAVVFLNVQKYAKRIREKEKFMNKKYYLPAIISMAFILSACTESSMVDEVNQTRNLINGRVNVDNDHKNPEDGVQTTEIHKGDTKVGESYSWQNGELTDQIKAPSGADLIEATVVNTVDGDTLDVVITNDMDYRIRLILVNTPESKGKYKDDPQPYALDAYEFTKNILVPGQKVWIEKGVEEFDKYDRLLAYIWLDNVVLNEEIETADGDIVLVGEKLGMKSLNELLLREGLAQVAIYPPNTQYVDEFEAIQKQAKKNQKGMWAK